MIFQNCEIIIQCSQLRPSFRLEHIIVAGVIQVVWGRRQEQTEEVESSRFAQVLHRSCPEHVVVDWLEHVCRMHWVVVVYRRVRLSIGGLDL